MLKKALHGVDKLSEWVGQVNAFILIIVIFLTFLEVICRYFFNRPTIWNNELCIHLFGTYMILGGAYVLQKKAHVSMDILSSTFNPRVKAIVELATCFLGIALLAVLIYKGAEKSISAIILNERSTSIWGPSMVPFRIVLPVGSFLFLLQYVANLIRSALVLIKGDLPDGC